MARRLVHAAAAILLVVCLSLVGEGSMIAAVGAKRPHVGRGSVAAGRAHTILATPDGRTMAWGAGTRGQLGDGGLVNRPTPVPIDGLDNVVAVSAGAAHTVAVTSTGEVYAWGANTFGRLGDGTRKRRLRPVRLDGLSSVTMVAAGRAHTLALTTSGTVYAWGRNTNGQLGTGSKAPSLVPVRIPGLSNIVAIAAGDNHSLAVSRDGRLFAWGDNQFSMLGDGTTKDRDRPVAIALTDVVAVAGGAAHSLALRRDGSVYSWGRGVSGALGTGSTRTATTPKMVNGVIARAIAAGRQFSAAILTDGSVATWGANESGQLGDLTTTPRDRPLVIQGLTRVESLALGDAHAVAVTELGDVRTWGEGDSGRLGTGSLSDQPAPFEIVSGVPDWGIEPAGETDPPEPPGIAPLSGFYSRTITVSLTPPVADSVIRFTLDGSEPTELSAIYSAPFDVSSSTTVNARTYSSGGQISVVRSETYTIDSIPPSIVASASPPLHDGWMTTPVTVSFECADDLALASCPVPVTVSTDGVQQVIGTAIDRAGNRVSAIVTVSLDRNPPVLSIAAPEDKSTTAEDEVLVRALAIDAASGVAGLRCDGEPVAVGDGSINCVVALRRGRNQIVLQAIDLAGHDTSVAITVDRIGVPTALTLTPATRTIEVNDVATISLRDEYGSEIHEASWTTSEPAVVSLSDDDPPIVAAAAIGTATITAEKDGMIATATIIVSPGLAPGDARWTLPGTPEFYSQPPLFTNRVALDVPAMFTVETQTWGDARLRAVSADGAVMWQQDAGGIPIMGDSFGGAIVGVLADLNSGTDYRAYSRIGGGTTRPWRFDSSGALGRPAQAHDGTLYAIEYLFGGLSIDGDEIWDKHAIVMDGATGRLISRTLLPREVDNFISEHDGQMIGPILCRSLPSAYAPDTIGPVAGGDGRGYLLVRWYERVKRASCNQPFRTRPDRTIQMGIDLMILSPSETPRRITLSSMSCSGALDTAVLCDLPLRAFQLLPDGVGGMLATLERATQLIGVAAVVQKSLVRIDEGDAIVERDVWPQFWLEMIGQDGIAITYDDGWRALDVRTGDVKWADPLPDLAPLAARPDGGLAVFDVNTGDLKMTDAAGAIESTQPFGLEWSAVHELGDWIGLRANALVSVVGEFADATRWSALKGNTQGQLTARRPGMGITLKSQKAKPPFPIYHTAIKIAPINQTWIEDWYSRQPDLTPQRDLFGNLFLTLGAGVPDGQDAAADCVVPGLGTLTNGINRESDLAKPAAKWTELPVSEPDEADAIVRLLDWHQRYTNIAPYACFPEDLHGFYNSNSYAHGLLDLAHIPHGEAPPKNPSPGWLTPVPQEVFRPR